MWRSERRSYRVASYNAHALGEEGPRKGLHVALMSELLFNVTLWKRKYLLSGVLLSSCTNAPIMPVLQIIRSSCLVGSEIAVTSVEQNRITLLQETPVDLMSLGLVTALSTRK
jgi:hypothetical protein